MTVFFPRSPLRIQLLIAAIAMVALPLRGRAAPASAIQSAATAKAAPSEAQKIADLTQQVFQETSQIRHLAILHPIKSGVRSSDEVKKEYALDENSSTSREHTEASNYELIKLGLAPAGFEIGPLYSNLMSEQVAGFYDHRTKTFYVTNRTDPDQLEVVMAHELTHALQDQHYDLSFLEKLPEDNSDYEMAARSLVEGDATYTMTRYMLSQPLRAINMLKSMKNVQSQVFDTAPATIQKLMGFPYEGGMKFVAALYQHGGWDEVSAAFKHLPRSTAQILHPEEYINHVEPIEIKLTDASQALGPGWKRIDYDVNGELGYLLVLEPFLRQSEAREDVKGWRGDRYATYIDRHKDIVLEQFTTWKDADAAEEFCRGYGERSLRRYEGINDETSTGITQVIQEKADHGSFSMWRTNQGAVAILRRGADVMIIEGAAEAKSRRLAEQLWPKSRQ